MLFEHSNFVFFSVEFSILLCIIVKQSSITLVVIMSRFFRLKAVLIQTLETVSTHEMVDMVLFAQRLNVIRSVQSLRASRANKSSSNLVVLVAVRVAFVLEKSWFRKGKLASLKKMKVNFKTWLKVFWTGGLSRNGQKNVFYRVKKKQRLPIMLNFMNCKWRSVNLIQL